MTGKVFSYLRFSSKPQELGASKARQLAMSEKWAAEKGLTIETHYEDLGVSAFKGKHRTEGNLAGFLTAVKTGKIESGSTLLIESIDRLSREEVGKALRFFMDIIDAGI